MRNLLLTIRYKGTAYGGFQVQQNAPTVCGSFQDGVEAVFGARYDVKGCSRTDAGVHANRYALSMKVESGIPCANIVKALNVNLPRDIAVLDCREVAESFHARYDAKGKRYIYKMRNSAVKDPFWAGLCWQIPQPLEATDMDKAARMFLGEHDFSAFCAAGGSVEDKVRRMDEAWVERQGDMITFAIRGNGFLYHMVRIMAGTLVDVGLGRTAPDDIPNIMAGKDRKGAGITAPPEGLYLDEVYY